MGRGGRGQESGDPILFLIFLRVGLKEACMPKFSFLGIFFTTGLDGRAARRLEESKIRLTQPSLAGSGAELGNSNTFQGLLEFTTYSYFRFGNVKFNLFSQKSNT